MDRRDVLLAVLALTYVALCPYTKVEESFNLQVCGPDRSPALQRTHTPLTDGCMAAP